MTGEEHEVWNAVLSYHLTNIACLIFLLGMSNYIKLSLVDSPIWLHFIDIDSKMSGT